MVNCSEKNETALLDRLRLQLVPGIGPRMLQLLLEHVGEAPEILAASRHRLLEVPRVGHGVADGIREAISRDRAREILARCQSEGITLIERGGELYSPLLEEIPDPPDLLYVKGQFELVDQVSVAVVGSRRCTAYGRRMGRADGDQWIGTRHRRGGTPGRTGRRRSDHRGARHGSQPHLPARTCRFGF